MADISNSYVIDVKVDAKSAQSSLDKMEKSTDQIKKNAKDITVGNIGKWDGQLKQASKSAAEVAKHTQTIEKGADNISKSSKSSWLPIWSKIAIIGVSAGYAIKKMVDEAAKIEQVNTQFAILTGNMDTAKGLVKDLIDFSTITPYNFEDVVGAGKSLISFGTQVKDVKYLLQELGDVSAAYGANLKEITLIHGQIQSASKLTGERYLQLAERGIVLKDVLADELGIATKDVADAISAGKVSFDIYLRAMKRLNDEGGPAFKGMEKLSETFSGKLSTLSGNFKLFSAAVGSFFLPAAKKVMDILNDILTPEKEKTKLDQLNEQIKNLTDPNQLAIRGLTIDDEEVQKELAQLKSRLEGLRQLKRAEDVKRIEEIRAEDLRKEKEDKERAEREIEALIAKEERLLEEQEKADKIKAEARKRYHQKTMNDAEKFQAYMKSKEVQKANTIIDINRQAVGAIAAIAKAGGKDHFDTWKKLAVVEATVAGYLAVAKALASGPPPWNYIAAAAVGVQSALQVRSIAMTKPPEFEDGGIVPGNSLTGDKVIARVNSQEMILNRGQQAQLFKMANGEGMGDNSVINAIRELGDKIANLEIVLKSEDIEIARSVNRAVENGFTLATS